MQAAEDAGAPAPVSEPVEGGARSGVKVPLPPGWSAQLSEEGSLLAGPEGHPVLRVDIRPGAGAQLPSSEALMASVRSAFRERSLRIEKQNMTESHTHLVVALGAEDGGREGTALFGATRLGDDLFLCASLPGAMPAEVEAAADACRGLSAPVLQRE